MKVLILHSHYQWSGGEDSAVDSEEQLLTTAGHSVARYDRNNEDIQRFTIPQHALLPATTLWSRKSLTEVRQVLLQDRPNVAHFHNTFPLISPAAYSACRNAGIPVVQTLHNYRLLCPTATFFREGKPCELCLGRKVPWPGVLHACYRDSRAATGVVAAMLMVHRALGTWTEMVDVYIALSEFSRSKFIEGGLPAAKIVVKPNFVDPDPGTAREPTDYALFVGRLSREKGLGILLAAWKQIGDRIPLLVLGDGPLRGEFEAQVNSLGLSQVRFGGGVDRETVLAAMRRARFLVVPSECYENFPTIIVEAFACGIPIIAANLGATREMVVDQQTGLQFLPGSPEDLAAKVDWAWAHPSEMEALGQAGRAEYVAKYTGDRNLRMLTDIYARAMESRGTGVCTRQTKP
jgi:glycosyltransferase involved in cell wall biosynthesis